MKKSILSLAAVIVISAAAVFAEGHTAVGLNYKLNDGRSYFGLSTDTTVFLNESATFGYFIGADADFHVDDASDWIINVLAAPAFRLRFEDSPVSFDFAPGISAAADSADMLTLGVGAYLGAAFTISEHLEFIAGASLGSNFISIPLDSPEVTASGNFYLMPKLALGFTF